MVTVFSIFSKIKMVFVTEANKNMRKCIIISSILMLSLLIIIVGCTSSIDSAENQQNPLVKQKDYCQTGEKNEN